jgi:DNA-directed RNA polymerase sigma subunit (sigma70/sigma32)
VKRPAARPARSIIDLGLEISALSLRPGKTRTLRELAVFCDCSWQNIWLIEQRALHKLRRAAFLRNDPRFRELRDYLSASEE